MERSEHGALTTNADYTEFQEYYKNTAISTPNQWTQLDNETIFYRFSVSLPGSNLLWERPEFFTFGGYSSLSYDLIFSVVVYNYNTSTKIFESSWYDNNTNVTINANMVWPDSPNPMNTYEVYVRRKDGNSLSRQDMRPSVCVIRGTRAFNMVQTTALPQDWLTGTAGTYTTDFSTMTTVVPTVCDIDDTEFNAFIDIPNKIVAGINLCVLGIGSLLNLKYVTFLVCFVLIVGLVAWIIH